ncbi:MAG TPA: cyclase family protein [Candidatus Udaeobacter sp.]|nr:cyclase family protein [Candidatus Udaeobacter sp.]
MTRAADPPGDWIDVTPVVSVETAVWPGDQPLQVRWLARLAAGDPVNLSAITLSPHLGAHVDAPRHFLPDGADVASLALSAFVGPARLVDVSAARDADGAIPGAALGQLEPTTPRLLLRTRQGAGPAAPLSAEAAARIAGSGLVLLGIDGASIDPPAAHELAHHRQLAAAGVQVLVGLELGAAPAGMVELIALPLRLAGIEASPVRAVLRPLPTA